MFNQLAFHINNYFSKMHFNEEKPRHIILKWIIQAYLRWRSLVVGLIDKSIIFAPFKSKKLYKIIFKKGKRI